MDKELKTWIKTYFLDIFCGMIFWRIIFGIYVGILFLLK